MKSGQDTDITFIVNLAESPPVLKESWKDSEGVSHVPLQRGGLLTMAPDKFLSLASRTGVSWLGSVVISKDEKDEDQDIRV